MSKDIEPLFYNIFTNLDKEQKPLFRVMKDNSDLNVNSKKFRNSINIQYFRETNFFDPSKSNLNDIILNQIFSRKIIQRIQAIFF